MKLLKIIYHVGSKMWEDREYNENEIIHLKIGKDIDK